MRGKLPAVRQYMTRIPVEVERCETVADALEVMNAHQIHHIPVMNGSHLQGIVSHRDVLQAIVDHGDAARAMALEEVAESNVVTVGPLTPINETAAEMLQRNAGSPRRSSEIR